jgi:DNA (cytosine-5)-methyltransferase 1
MKHGSLFSGIGGFDLAAEWMGWENIFHCEWNPFGQKVLHYYWPKAEQFTDITKTDFTKYANKIDILTGGFPCQPYSQAGKRKGKEDERHLWPHMLRAIKEIQPRWVVGENVFGLVNWSGGLVFHEVQTDLEAAGYEVFPYVLPAAAVNAPHRRDRIWFVAYSNNSRANIGMRSEREWKARDRFRGFTQPEFGQNGINGDVADTDGTRQQGSGINREEKEYFGSQRSCEQGPFTDSESQQSEWMRSQQQEYSQSQQGQSGRNNRELGNQRIYTNTNGIGGRQNEWITNGKSNVNDKNSAPGTWENFPTQSPICDGNDGIPTGLDGITFSKWRNESIKAGGNAIVPNVVFQIFKAIEQYELLKAPAPYIRQ